MEIGQVVNNYHPDGLTAALLAASSFDDTVCIFNGPQGCFNYQASVSGHYANYDLVQKIDNRVQCLRVENEDYIFGTRDKIEKALRNMDDNGYSLIVLIDSPGVSVTGDSLRSFRCTKTSPFLHLKSRFDSIDYTSAYDHSVKQILDTLKEPPFRHPQKRSVNLVGCPPSLIGWKESVEELTDILALAGIDVMSTPGCGGSYGTLGTSFDAEATVPIIPEYCKDTCKYYSDLGIGKVDTGGVVPIGFDNTRRWIESVCVHFGSDPSKAVEYIELCQKRTSKLMRISYYGDMLERSRFCVQSVPSVESSLSNWLESYVGMIRSDVSDLQDCRFMFGMGFATKQVGFDYPGVRGIALEFPPLYKTRFVPVQTFGCKGSLYILDELFSGI